MKYFLVHKSMPSGLGPAYPVTVSIFCASLELAESVLGDAPGSIDERETEGYISYDSEDPYTWYEGMTVLGHIRDSRAVYSHTALAVPGDESAQRSYREAVRKSAAEQEWHYSRPWV